MATLTRVTGKVFGGEAPLDQIGQFGSALAGTKLNTQDVATIQALDAYSQGWGSAVISTRNFPPIEEVNGALKTISYQACYLLQEGIPTYDINTEYSNTSIVKSISGNELILYVSNTNGNIGNPLTDSTYWSRVIFSGTGAIGAPQFTMNFNATLPDNCIWLEGATVSRTDYSNLFAIYGTTYGAGNGSTTFKLPDFRSRAFFGGNTAGYILAGLPNLGLSTASSGAHTHSRGTMNISGSFRITDVAGDANLTVQQVTGAFSGGTVTQGGTGHLQVTSGNYYQTINFNASNSWTGSTSSNGTHTHTITSSNSLVGASSTVQPPSIKLRVYTRYR